MMVHLGPGPIFSRMASNVLSMALTPDPEQCSKRIHAARGPAKQVVGKSSVAHHFREYFLKSHRIHSQSSQVLQAQIHVVIDRSPGKVRLKVHAASRIGRKD